MADTATAPLESLETLFKETMSLYWTYMDALEAAISRTPESDTATLQEIADHIKEVKSAMEHDINLFDKTISEDSESLSHISEASQVEAIHNMLKQ